MTLELMHSCVQSSHLLISLRWYSCGLQLLLLNGQHDVHLLTGSQWTTGRQLTDIWQWRLVPIELSCFISARSKMRHIDPWRLVLTELTCIECTQNRRHTDQWRLLSTKVTSVTGCTEKKISFHKSDLRSTWHFKAKSFILLSTHWPEHVLGRLFPSWRFSLRGYKHLMHSSHNK